jgi:hypothetical protein
LAVDVVCDSYVEIIGSLCCLSSSLVVIYFRFFIFQRLVASA